MVASRRPPYRQWFGDEGWHRIMAGDYPCVYVATPPPITGEVLLRLASSPVRLVFAEKPWFKDLKAACQIIPVLLNAPPVYRFIDHYLCRPALRWLLEQNLLMLLGGPPREIEGRLLESAAPVSPAMSVGVLNDTLIHMITIVRRICPGCAVEIKRVQAARYQGAPTDSETFVRLQAVVDTTHPLNVVLTAAKAYPPQGASKALTIRGPAAALHVNLDHETVSLVTSDRTRLLYSQGHDLDAYPYLLRRLDAEDPSPGLGACEALAVLRILNGAQKKIPPALPLYDPIDASDLTLDDFGGRSDALGG